MASSIKELKEAFELFDRDGDGELTTVELQAVFKMFGVSGKMQNSDAKALLEVADKNTSGVVSMQEFRDLWAKLNNIDDENIIREDFKNLDADEDGSISREEMLNKIKGCESFDDIELQARKCIEELDFDGDGKISYPEFLMAWLSKSSL